MSIFITGDCHGEYTKFNAENFKRQKDLTKNDYMIVAGDFGYWDNSPDQIWWRKWLEDKPFTTLFIDGNHENYDMLAELPVTEWNGGKVQFVNDSIIHLMRGQVFNIDGTTFFAFGGAKSHDIRDGIFEKGSAELKNIMAREHKTHEYLMYRVNHESWWKEEMPNENEMEEGLINLEKAGNKVDYIVTHEGPSSNVRLFGRGFEPDAFSEYLEKIRVKASYKEWFFGHYHVDMRAYAGRETVLYDKIYQIA